MNEQTAVVFGGDFDFFVVGRFELFAGEGLDGGLGLFGGFVECGEVGAEGGDGEAGPSETPGGAPQQPGPAPVPGGDSLSLAAWPAEKKLFCDLVDAYAFGNPRLMLRLEITWRLLKSLWFGKAGYRYEDAEILLRLLFWRECRLQQTPEHCGALDAWLVSGEGSGFPEELRAESGKLRAALGSLPDLLKQGTIMELPVGRVLATVDAVLLPAAPPRPETTPKPEATPKPVAQSKPVARAKQKAQAQAAGSAKA